MRRRLYSASITVVQACVSSILLPGSLVEVVMYQVIALKNQKNSGKPDGLACRTIPSKTSTLYCWSSAHVCNISDVFQTSAAVTLHHSTSSLLLLLLYTLSQLLTRWPSPEWLLRSPYAVIVC